MVSTSVNVATASAKLRWSAARFNADCKRIEIDHQVGEHGAKNCTDTLNDNVGNNFTPRSFATCGKNKGHSGVKVCTRKRPQYGDEYYEIAPVRLALPFHRRCSGAPTR